MKAESLDGGRVDGQWVLPGYSNALRAIARSTPGLRFDKGPRGWGAYGYIDAVALAAEKFQARGLRLDASALAAAPTPPDYVGGDKRLRGYQWEAIRFLLSHREAILADDMGLGKTAATLTAAHNTGGRTLVVCPNYVRGVWEAEITKWLGPRLTALPHGIKAPAPIGPGPEFVVCHYDILPAWAEQLIAWNPSVVVFDEAHLGLQSERTSRSKAARAVSAGAACRWALTGTPLTNRPIDLWNIVDTISPGRFGVFPAFGRRYAAGHQEEVAPGKVVWRFDGHSHEDELAARLRYFMLRRTGRDVSLELPARTRQVIPIAVKTVGLPPGAGAAFARKALDVAADQKLPAAIELIRGHLRNGAKVVVFCWRRAVAETIAESLIEDGHAEVIHGGVGAGVRATRINRWRNEGEPAALVATIDCCATGIDLTAGSVGVFVELTWEPHELLQAEARLYRFGQTVPVLIQYLIATGSADEVIAARVVSKLETFETIIGKGTDGLRGDLDGAGVDNILDELDAWAAGRRKR